MGSNSNSGRGTTTRRKSKGTPKRARQHTNLGMAEMLEARCLLAVTTTTPIPIAPTETFSFTGNVMHFTANDAGPFTATIDWGDATPPSAGVITPSGGGFDISGTHTYAEDGPFTATVTITDTADATSVTPTTTATVGEQSLSISAQNFSVPENSSAIVLVATAKDPGSPDPGSDFTATIDWGDGTTTPGTVTATGGGNFNITGSHVYADEGTHSVTTTFFETIQPGFSVSAASTGTVTEADVLSSGAIVIPPGSLIEGAAYSGLVATFSDTGFPTNLASDFTATIDWGDGTTTAGAIAGGAGTFTVSGTHTFVEEGTSPITVVVADDAPGTATITIAGPLVIADAPLTASPVAVNGTEGAPLTNVDVATFTDANPFGNVGDFLATINWGDGTPVTAGVVLQDAAGTFHVQGSHTYVEENAAVYAITVSIIDNGGGRTVTDPSDSQATANSTATILQSPLLPVADAVVATEGTATAVGTPLALFTDTGGADAVSDYTATVNWGDGSATTPATITLLGSGGNFQVSSATVHTYAEEGIFPVTVTITDLDPANPGSIPTTAATTSTATVSDAPLTAVATGAIAANTGALLTNVSVGAFTDGNTGSTTSDFTAVIDWGDGSPTSLGTFSSIGGVGFNVEGTHAYAKPGTYTTTAIVTDDGGSTLTISGTATITDQAVVLAVRNFTAVEGQNTGTIVLGTFSDPNPLATVSDVTATLIAGGWGDTTPGVPVTLAVRQIGGTAISTIFEITGSHTYAEEGTFTVSITVTTSGGVTTPVTTGLATVLDAALTSSNGRTITGVEGSPTGPTPTGPLIGTFTDSNQSATSADFTTGTGSVVVDWGDGSSPQTLAAANVVASGSANGVVFSIRAPHTYAEEGQYAIIITVTDAGGANTFISSMALITDAKLSASATQPSVTTTEAALFPVPRFGAPAFRGPVASFTDLNLTAPISDFKATIAWGDDTAIAAGTITQPGGAGTAIIVTGAHTYADSGVNGGTGSYPIQVFIVDVGGSKLTVTNTASVADRPINLTGQLNPASDKGVSNTDDITKVKQPHFFGTSEPLSHVTLFATRTGGGPLVQIGETQAKGNGSWNIVSHVALADGSYVITATAVDQFGVTTTAAPVTITAHLVIDTAGPVIASASFNRLSGQVDYVIQGPSPASGVNLATLLDSANYELTKVHANKAFPGKWIVTNISVTPGTAAHSFNVAVTFNNGAPIRGGFFLFTIRDSTRHRSSVQDIAGNSLDGEFYGSFPSGNGIPGGDFIAEFSSFHNKIFPPQTIVGTASNANGGIGGPTVGAVHGGHSTLVVPHGGNAVSVKHLNVNPRGVIHHAKTNMGSHPKGPVHG